MTKGRNRSVKISPAASKNKQRPLDLAAETSAMEGIRQGLVDVAAGRTYPAREVLDKMRAKYDIPR